MQATASNLIEDYHLLSYDVLDSTNEEAKRNGGQRAPSGRNDIAARLLPFIPEGAAPSAP